MKKRVFYLTVLLIIVILHSCTKQIDSKLKSLIVTGIKGAKGSEMVSIRLDSGVIKSTPVTCYVLGSTVFDYRSGGYGYVDCDTVFKLVNPETGILMRSIKLPGCISEAVIDSDDNMLIGRYSTITYNEEPDTIANKSIVKGEPTYTNYVIRIDLATGAIVSQNQIDIGKGVYACSYYYNQEGKGYVMLRADLKLITINPSTGAVMKEVNIGKALNEIVYNPDNGTIIGMTYSHDADRNYIEVFDAETGVQISKKEVMQRDDYYACISGYDAESNCYILVNVSNEILFIEISTGEIKKLYKLDSPLNDLKIWRR